MIFYKLKSYKSEYQGTRLATQRAKFEYRISKLETISKFKLKKFKSDLIGLKTFVGNRFLSFTFVSDFVLRISNFLLQGELWLRK
ncbi:MAG: hypothetical protein A3F31_02095 [Candidatus Levybacteria bacterium RIFCSPHIGHO2_12_FULL_38_12]|nr:MAG: hypothetical protein A3F31_02095 [Candidatus Levybacteria bacterium RIFCSPHIGHO2_12_FULL_38_12]OGH44276.1 MAG: hypothetical protein A3J14_05475 [Candidatus Levybacteria bacterium RIFCSPLOWO2_02_FULL_37_18]OGH51700.1 MAG: hypothetical protein A3G13_00690 [Candidatus Levybacteria bacterium RIFCSPLOWO2_12_FULL_37_7]